MKKYIIKFLSNRFAVLITFTVVFLVMLSCLLYYAMGRGATYSLTQQFLVRQKTITKTGANSITSLLDLSSKTLILLTEDDDLAFVTVNTQERMQTFIENWSSTPVIAILRLDSKGNRIAAATNIDKIKLEGTIDKSDAKCIGWAETAKPGEICFTDPGIPSQEEAKQFGYVIGMVTPIHAKNKYNGSLVLGISLNKLTESYLDSLRVTDDTFASILTSDGNIIYTDNPDFLTKNLLEQLRQNIFLGSTIIVDDVEQILKTGEAGFWDVVLPQPVDYRLQRMLVAYAPIQVGDGHWMLITRTPYFQALQMITPFYTRQIGVMAVGFLILLLLAVIVLPGRSLIRKRKQKTSSKVGSSRVGKK
jgi:hypothetical protein